MALKLRQLIAEHSVVINFALLQVMHAQPALAKNTRYPFCEGWNFNSGNYLFTTDTK